MGGSNRNHPSVFLSYHGFTLRLIHRYRYPSNTVDRQNRGAMVSRQRLTVVSAC